MLPPALAPPRENRAESREAPPPPEERAGARVYRETPSGTSRGERYRRAAVRKSGDVSGTVDKIYSIVQDGLGISRPSGQHSAPPRGDYARPDHPGAGTSDPVVGLVAGAAMLAEALRVTRARRAKKKREHDGNH